MRVGAEADLTLRMLLLESAFLVGPDDASRWKLCDVPLQREVTFRPSAKTIAAPVVPGNSYDHRRSGQRGGEYIKYAGYVVTREERGDINRANVAGPFFRAVRSRLA